MRSLVTRTLAMLYSLQEIRVFEGISEIHTLQIYTKCNHNYDITSGKSSYMLRICLSTSLIKNEQFIVYKSLHCITMLIKSPGDNLPSRYNINSRSVHL